MTQQVQRELLTGFVEADEMFIGAKLLKAIFAFDNNKNRC
jgi:hypothetical protein